MSARLLPRLIVSLLAIALLAGCGYDYMQNTDRVAFRAGDAVRANLESETINPSRPSVYSTAGLGKNGKVSSVVVTPVTTSSAATTSSSGGTSAPASGVN